LKPQFYDICGITQEELEKGFKGEIGRGPGNIYIIPSG
jgi:hypothetical protein